jgi:hypothetical protein
MYAGITGEWINPSFIAGSPYVLDVNLVTVHSYFDNNYLYIYPTNVPDLIDDDGENKIKLDNTQQKEYGTWAKYWIENRDNNNWGKNAYLNVLVQGPSFMFNYKKWSFSIEDDARVAFSAVHISPLAAKLAYEDADSLTYLPFQNRELAITKFRINAAAWDEIGITVARQLENNKNWEVNCGITLKHLNGIAGGYCINNGIDITIPNYTSLYFKDLSVKCGYADNLDANKAQTATVCGTGTSTDLGVTFEKKTVKNSYQCPNFCDKALDLQYLWKLGFSLVDIGYINFNQCTNNYTVNNGSDDWVNITKIRAKGQSGLDSILKAHFTDFVYSKNNFTMMLPWAASVQFDYNIGYNLYINGTWVQRIPHFGLIGVDRANSIAITPKYDTRRFGVALPITFYDYLWPRAGIAFRFNNFLIVGSDKIGCILGQSLSGEDFYVSLKFSILKICRKHKRKGLPSFLPDMNFINQRHN